MPKAWFLQFWNFVNFRFFGIWVFGIAVYVFYLQRCWSHSLIFYLTISGIPPSNFLVFTLSLNVK